MLIRSNHFVDLDFGIHLFFHAGSQFDSLTLLNNEIALNTSSGAGITVCDVRQPGTSGSITNVTALNNIVRYPDWSPRWGSPEGGLAYTDMQQAVFGNNEIALGTEGSLAVRGCPAGVILPVEPEENCAPVVIVPPPPAIPPACMNTPPPGYQRAWFNNRDLTGASLEVRCTDQGVVKPAAQPQWPP